MVPLTTNPHQKGERATPREELDSWMKDRMIMGSAKITCSKPRKVSSDKQHR